MRKLGLKILIITVPILYLTRYFDINPYFKLTAGVFLIGTGLTLIFLDGITNFKE